jgi:hypothetical protein
MMGYDPIDNAHELAGELVDEWPLFRSREFQGICSWHAEELVTELVEIDRAAEYGAIWAEQGGAEE